MPLNVCVVGCGDRGSHHARAIRERPDARVVSVADLQADRREAIAAETGATPYGNWREAIAHEGVDLVCQALPTCLHAEVTRFAAERGCHVFGEKPLALTLADGQAMLQAVERAGVVFMPCFQYRDRGLYLRYREAYRRGDLGSPVIFRFTDIREVRPKLAMHRRSENGGVVIDMACHLVDLLRWITDAEPRTVCANGQTFGHGKPRLAGIEDLAIDTACIEVGFDGGHQLQLDLCWGLPEGFAGSIGDQWLLGPQGAARPTPEGVEILRADHRQIWPGGPEPGIAVRLEHLIAAIEGRHTPDITGADALIALRVSLAALESIETGQTVRLD